MKLLEKEKNIEYLFNYFDEHEEEIVKVVFKDKIIEKAQLDTMYENEEDEDQYNVILMRDLNNKSLFEISYKNIPLEIISNGENIIKQ